MYKQSRANLANMAKNNKYEEGAGSESERDLRNIGL